MIKKIFAALVVAALAVPASAGQTHAEKCQSRPDSSCIGFGIAPGALPPGAPSPDTVTGNDGSRDYWTGWARNQTNYAQGTHQTAICASGYQQIAHDVRTDLHGEIGGLHLTRNTAYCSVDRAQASQRVPGVCEVRLLCRPL